MAVFRSLKSFIERPNKKNNKARSFLSFFASSTPSPSFLQPSIFSSFPQSSSSTTPLSFALRLTSSHSRFVSPLSRWIPLSGPLFLSSPPWQLSQSATPLYLHGEFVLRKAESLKLNLLERRTKLGYGSISSVPELLNLIDQKEFPSKVDSNGGVSEGFVNLPNLISMGRLVSGPFLGWMIMNEWYLSAFAGLAVSGATDWLDGYVARKMGIKSVVGSYLDPLADKVLIGCVAVAMVKNDLLPSWLVGLVVFRDVGLITGAFYKRATSLGWEWKSWSEFTNLDGARPQKVEPLFISKVNTVFQLILVAAALLQPELGTEETKVYITYLSWLVASTTAASTVAYGAQHLQNGSKLVARGSR